MARVLIADDDALFRDMFAHSLEFANVDIVTVANGRDAIETIMAQPLDVLLLDVKMPDVSGLEIIRWLANDRRYQHIKVVMITGHHSAQNTPEAELVDAILMKPVHIPELITLVQGLLASAV